MQQKVSRATVGAATTDANSVRSPLVADPGSLPDVAGDIAAGRVSVRAVVERSLERIDEVEPQVHGWRLIDRDDALAQAEVLSDELKAGKSRGPLHGIPVAIKDVIDVAGRQTRAGSATRAHVPPATVDAQVVSELRAAGAILLGKAHTTEFAYFDGPPPTRNPWNLAHTPGGSSAGPAALVAAGMVPLSLGTQTAGSVSRPAAYCGIAAFKPSTRAWSSFGVVPFAPTFDTVGVFGYRVTDAMLAARVLMPPFLPRAARSRSRKLGLLEDPILHKASPVSMQMRATAAQKLRDAGFDVEPCCSPIRFDEIIAWHKTITEYEMARPHPTLVAAEEVSPALCEAVRRGREVEPASYERALAALASAAETFWTALRDYAALIFPAAPDVAPAGMKTGDPNFIIPFTALGGPIVSIPAAIAPDGLPLGLMLIGTPGVDWMLASLAERVASVIELPR